MGFPHNGAMRRCLAVLLLGASLASAAPARADNPEAVKAFEEGRKLRDQKDYEKAAAAFERSLAAEASIGANYNVAFSYEQLGRIRDALDAYRRAARMAKDKGDPREKEATEALTKLLETHSYITLIVPDDVDKAAGVRIVVDGEPVPQKQVKGEVFRAGPQHEVVVSAPGRKDRRSSVANKQAVTIALGDLHDAPSSGAPPAPAPSEPTSGGWGWQKWTGAGMVAGGVVSLAVTGVLFFPYLAERLSLDSEIGDKCPSGTCPSGTEKASSQDLARRNNANIQDADDKRPAMIITGVLGGLLVGGGVYLLATAPTSGTTEQGPPPPSALRVRVVPRIGTRDNGLSVVGTF
jgi:hypothetical protein